MADEAEEREQLFATSSLGMTELEDLRSPKRNILLARSLADTEALEKHLILQDCKTSMLLLALCTTPKFDAKMLVVKDLDLEDIVAAVKGSRCILLSCCHKT